MVIDNIWRELQLFYENPNRYSFAIGEKDILVNRNKYNASLDSEGNIAKKINIDWQILSKSVPDTESFIIYVFTEEVISKLNRKPASNEISRDIIKKIYVGPLAARLVFNYINDSLITNKNKYELFVECNAREAKPKIAKIHFSEEN